jgi:hypothetical protein
MKASGELGCARREDLTKSKKKKKKRPETKQKSTTTKGADHRT